jgi:hypothetical protein
MVAKLSSCLAGSLDHGLCLRSVMAAVMIGEGAPN